MTRRKKSPDATIPKEMQGHPQMRIVHWRFRCAKRRVVGDPLTGAYYWIPLPDKQGEVVWELMEFFDLDYHEGVAHADAWPEVVNYLAVKWHKSPGVLQKRLANSLYGLPRGRGASAISRRKVANERVVQGKT